MLEDISVEQRIKHKENLMKSVWNCLEKKNILIERIRNVIIEMFHYADELPQINYSEYPNLGINLTKSILP